VTGWLKTTLGALALALWVAVVGLAPAWAGDVHRLALQITDKDPQKMNAVLNVAANVSRHYSEIGQQVEIRVVAFNLGLHMLRDDTSPVKERLQSFAQSMPNVVFDACNNTLQGMAKKEGKVPPLVNNAVVVPSGAVELMELAEKGWVVLRP
jgi:intracellular sulfur oxidation DsrE/DsrF family protein